LFQPNITWQQGNLGGLYRLLSLNLPYDFFKGLWGLYIAHACTQMIEMIKNNQDLGQLLQIQAILNNLIFFKFLTNYKNYAAKKPSTVLIKVVSINM